MKRTQQLIEEINELFIGMPDDHKELMASLQTKSEAELATTAAQLQTLRTQHERTKLELTHHGVANTERNWSLIAAKVGSYFTTEQVYRAVQTDDQFKQSLEWRGTPFGEVERQQQQDRAQDEKNFKLFQGCAKAATAHGRNVAGNRANYGLVKDAIDDQAQDFNTANVTNMIFRGGLALAPNDQEVADGLVKQREEQERIRLATMIVDSMQSWNTHGVSGAVVRNEYARNDALKKVKQWSLAELRSRVEVIEKNRFLASLSKEDVTLIARGEAMERRAAIHAQGGYRTLPSEIDKKAIKQASSATLRDWIRLYGSKQITARLRGE